MKVCCGNGKAYDSLTDIEKFGCNQDHCLGPIQEYLFLQFCGTFNTKDCISTKDLSCLLSKANTWEEWILSQIEQEGVDQWKDWYDRMSKRCDLHIDLITAYNKLFGEK
jgi:hypothetical protein